MFMGHWFRVGWGTLQLLKRKGRPEWTKDLENVERGVRQATVEAGFAKILGTPEPEAAFAQKWWGMGVSGLARALKLADEYDWIYAQLSDYSHTGLRTLHMFTRQVSETEIRMM
jgi:hypothetical protein